MFLSHVVGKDGVHTNRSLVQDVEKWPVPQNLKELQAFLGLTNYYRRFVQGYADIARSLHNLTRKGVTYHWGAEQKVDFGALKKSETKAPILAYPLAKGRMILDTDASNLALGLRGLSLTQVGAWAQIHERYCVTRRELLTVVAFCHQYKHYLLGRQFLLRTYHSSLA